MICRYSAEIIFGINNEERFGVPMFRWTEALGEMERNVGDVYLAIDVSKKRSFMVEKLRPDPKGPKL